MKLQASETEALQSAAGLVKYVAESPMPLPPEIVQPIANAWKAQEDDTWDPRVSTEFWTAYGALCDRLKPVTVDTIAAKATFHRPRWLWFGDLRPTTLPGQTARRYRQLLIVLLAFAVVFGFINSVTKRYTDDIKTLIGESETPHAQLNSDITSLQSLLKPFSDKSGKNVDQLPWKDFIESAGVADNKVEETVRNVQRNSRLLVHNIQRIRDRISGVDKMTIFMTAKQSVTPSAELSNTNDANIVSSSYYDVKMEVREAQHNAFLLDAIYSALVPMLLGAIGATTYVLRLISEQIREVTFSSTSQVRHSVRVLLGALAGFAIGLGFIGVDSGLSAGALSFVAGYAIEPVFSTFDGIAAKFARS